jgi:hypothetical protein
MLNIVMLSADVQNDVTLSVVILNVIMLSAVMLSKLSVLQGDQFGRNFAIWAIFYGTG